MALEDESGKLSRGVQLDLITIAVTPDPSQSREPISTRPLGVTLWQSVSRNLELCPDNRQSARPFSNADIAARALWQET